jgi:RNA polymerase sigma-70 factor, ECF subfamily
MTAFSVMVKALSPVAWRIAFRILADNESAEDAAQESMVKLWRNLGRFRDNQKFSSWFYRIVVNSCYDELRKRKKNIVHRTDERTWFMLGEIVKEDNSEGPSVEEYAEIMKAVTEKLTPAQKSVFILSDLEGMNSGQIEEITGMGRNTVKANLHYARKRVMELIKERF